MTRIVDPVLDDLRQKILRMGSLAEAILQKSLDAIFKRDAALAREVRIDDLEIDRMELAIDEAVLRALATQAPVADDLRKVVAIKMMATDIERVGDLARNIAKSALRLSEDPAGELPDGLRILADESRRILRSALDSFSQYDAKRAADVLDDDDVVDERQDDVIRNAIAGISRNPARTSQEVDFILVAKNLERVADHATNIAEDVILVTEARNVKHASKLAADPGAAEGDGDG
ncbi:MAG: phosphate transport system regulatory protein PhoU [Deltaproteobacteria bacterium]|jgi:phosphate transport system protein|nr:phosphate transport system regulatory protein PhoU [Deltaproteobacteria bacterium]